MKANQHKPVDGLAVIITSHPKQQVWMEHCLRTYETCPYPLYMGYDDDKTPPQMDWLTDSLEVYPTELKAGELGHARGELFQMAMLIHRIQVEGFRFFYKCCADMTLYRPRGLRKLQNLLGSNHWDIIHAGTSSIYGRVDAMAKMLSGVHAKVRCAVAEGFLKREIFSQGIRNLPLKRDEWDRLLGRIHVQGEHAIETGTRGRAKWENGEIW